MHWAKTQASARYNLATSGVPNIALAEFAWSEADLELTGSSPYGYEPLRAAIAEKYNVTCDQVVLATGTSQANHLAMATIVEPGDDVLIEHPVYEPITATARFLGAQVRSFHRRSDLAFGVDTDEIEALLTTRTRLVVVSNLHNPTSRLEDTTTLRRIGELAHSVGARVLVDEVYLDAVFDSTPESAIHLGPAFLVTNSLTKVYGLSGLRCGWILADADTARRARLLNDIFGATGVHIAERLGVAAFGQLDRFANRSRQLLDTNREAYYAFLDSRDDLSADRFDWGTTSFPRLVDGNVEHLCSILRSRFDTTVVPGSFFGCENHFRVGLTAEPSVFSSGLQCLGAALDALRRDSDTAPG